MQNKKLNSTYFSYVLLVTSVFAAQATVAEQTEAAAEPVCTQQICPESVCAESMCTETVCAEPACTEMCESSVEAPVGNPTSTELETPTSAEQPLVYIPTDVVVALEHIVNNASEVSPQIKAVYEAAHNDVLAIDEACAQEAMTEALQLLEEQPELVAHTDVLVKAILEKYCAALTAKDPELQVKQCADCNC